MSEIYIYIFQFFSEISKYTAKSRSMCCCPPTAMAVPFPNFGSYEWLFGLNMRARPTCIKYDESLIDCFKVLQHA